MAASSLDRDSFLTHLRQSGLVSDEQLANIRTRHSATIKARSLARSLVDEGLLTRFQAERLLAGRSVGFLLGPYRILDQLGRGGMGRVYKAEHRTMGRMVALKVLAPELLNTERAVQLFLHEIRAVAQLVHPHIVTAYDANEAGGRYYLVLEFVDGPNLDQLIRRQGPLSPGLACDYIRQAALGLQCAHQLRMVHRDIKPANILVQRHGQHGDDTPGLVKISDFGLARLAVPPGELSSPGTILTQKNAVMGTPDYLSPEQSRCLHGTDIRSDVYSLGCTFYFLLTGHVPFPGGTALDKLIRHSTELPRAVPRFRADVPAAVLVILERMIAKNPDHRFDTPAQVAEALRPFAVSGPTPWAPHSPVSLESSTRVPVMDLAPAGSDGDVPLDALDDLSALAKTMTGSLEMTPGPVATRSQRLEQEARDRVKTALLAAIVIVSGFLAMIALAALVSYSTR